MVDPIYATDEDIALRASADYAILCPRDQKLASGVDGVIDPSNRWQLRSDSVDFAAQGVAPGQVVQLLGPPSAFRPPGESFIVVRASSDSVLLRRKGQGSGVGQPPAPVLGLSGVEFLISTLAPQIARAGFEIATRFGVLSSTSGRTVADLLDPRELVNAVVLEVLHRQYRDMSREGGGPNADALSAKAQAAKSELDEWLSRAIIHWRMGDAASTTRNSARITR